MFLFLFFPFKRSHKARIQRCYRIPCDAIWFDLWIWLEHMKDKPED